MGNLQGYNAGEFEPAQDFEALPEGNYNAVIVDSGFENTKAGDGQFLKLKLQVLDGPFKGRTLFDRLNLDNPNETAVDIAKRTLSSICRAVSRMTPNDSRDLHSLPLVIRVVQEPYNGSMSNKIKAYKSIKPADGGPAQAPAPSTGGGRAPESAATGTTTNGGRKAPWAR